MLVLVHLRRYYKNVYIIALLCFLMYFYFAWKGTLKILIFFFLYEFQE